MLRMLTGVSGSGKTTEQRRMIKEEGWVTLYNFVTRAPREGEEGDKEKDEYIFLTKDQQQFKATYGDFAEDIIYNGNNYCMSEYTTDGEKLKDSSKDVVVIVTPEGREQFITYCEKWDVEYESFFLNITPEIQEERLRARGDSEEEILKRKKDFDFLTPSAICKNIYNY